VTSTGDDPTPAAGNPTPAAGNPTPAAGDPMPVADGAAPAAGGRGTPAIGTFADLVATILAGPARLGAVRVVAVDGPSGAGKTTFAGRLADALATAAARVAVVHTDDLLDGWDDQFEFWGRLEATVLAPLRDGRPGRYPVYDWVRGRFGGTRELPVPDVLIIEGGTATRTVVRPELTLSVFVSAPAALRMDRALSRDGAQVRAPLRRWMAAEDRYFAAAGTCEWVDHLIDGASNVRHDPRSEFVRLPRPGDDHD
jgi:uridine kinase